MVKLLVCFVDLTRRKFTTLLLLIDILMNMGSVAFAVMMLARSIDVKSILLFLTFLIYLFFCIYVLVKLAQSTDLRLPLLSTYGAVRMALSTILLICFIVFLSRISDHDINLMDDTPPAPYQWFFYPSVVGLSITAFLSFYWSIRMFTSVLGSQSLEEMEMSNPNDYLKDNDIFQD